MMFITVTAQLALDLDQSGQEAGQVVQVHLNDPIDPEVEVHKAHEAEGVQGPLTPQEASVGVPLHFLQALPVRSEGGLHLPNAQSIEAFHHNHLVTQDDEILFPLLLLPVVSIMLYHLALHPESTSTNTSTSY